MHSKSPRTPRTPCTPPLEIGEPQYLGQEIANTLAFLESQNTVAGLAPIRSPTPEERVMYTAKPPESSPPPPSVSSLSSDDAHVRRKTSWMFKIGTAPLVVPIVVTCASVALVTVGPIHQFVIGHYQYTRTSSKVYKTQLVFGTIAGMVEALIIGPIVLPVMLGSGMVTVHELAKFSGDNVKAMAQIITTGQSPDQLPEIVVCV